MDALVSAILLGIFHLFPVPVADLPAKLEYVPTHSLSILSEVTHYRMLKPGELEKDFTRNFLDTSRKEHERTAYHLDSNGNVTAWEEYGNDSLIQTRGTTVYAEGLLQSAVYADSAGKVFRTESFTWSRGELQSMEIVFIDAETTLTQLEYDQGRLVKYFSPSDGPGTFTSISYPSPDTIRGEEYRDSLLAFTTELIIADGKLAKVQYLGAATTYTYGDAIAIRPRAALPRKHGASVARAGFDGLGRRLRAAVGIQAVFLRPIF